MSILSKKKGKHVKPREVRRARFVVGCDLQSLCEVAGVFGDVIGLILLSSVWSNIAQVASNRMARFKKNFIGEMESWRQTALIRLVPVLTVAVVVAECESDGNTPYGAVTPNLLYVSERLRLNSNNSSLISLSQADILS
jgi:hypothetical protein